MQNASEREIVGSYIENQTAIPERTLEALRRYVEARAPTGAFLANCLVNDFVVAVCLADDENLRSIVRLAKWMYVNLPSACWGSPAKVEAWLRGEGRGELEPGV